MNKFMLIVGLFLMLASVSLMIFLNDLRSAALVGFMGTVLTLLGIRGGNP